jgi:ATP-dependent Clp protease adapter protein ClpS
VGHDRLERSGQPDVLRDLGAAEAVRYNRDKAEKLMLDVHHKGKAIVSSGARERMEYDATRLHGYGLWATVDQP